MSLGKINIIIMNAQTVIILSICLNVLADSINCKGINAEICTNVEIFKNFANDIVHFMLGVGQLVLLILLIACVVGLYHKRLFKLSRDLWSIVNVIILYLCTIVGIIWCFIDAYYIFHDNIIDSNRMLYIKQ